MANPYPSDVSPISPILTNMVLGYQQSDDRFIATKLAPPVPADHPVGTYFIFTKKYWFFDEMQKRAYGTDYAETGFGVDTSTFNTDQFALAIPIADETRQASLIPMDLEAAALKLLAQRSLVRKEVAMSADFFKTGLWGTDFTGGTTGAKWSDFSAGDPVSNIRAAWRIVSQNTGYKANTLACGQTVDEILNLHPDIVDRLKYTQAATSGNVENALADVLGIQNYWVSRATYSNTTEAASFVSSDIIGKVALVAWVDPGAGIFGASALKTFFWQPGGGMGGARMWRDEKKDADLLKYKEQWDQVNPATDLGYYFTTIVA
jgi:hypothetical protein